MFLAGFSRGSRGVAILLKRNFAFSLIGTKSDPMGRYVAVWGLVEGVAHNFISVYVPPQMQSLTFRDLGEVVLSLPPGVTVIGGDCNAMMDRERDSSRGAGVGTHGADARFQAWTESLGLCDVWRTWNPGVTQYTHSSAAHGSHSRIDYLLVPGTDMARTSGSRILPRGISDHSPVQLDMVGTVTGRRPMWRLNAWYMQDSELVKKLTKDIENYF